MTNEAFVKKYMEAYNSGKNYNWIASELDVNYSKVAATTNKLRKAGVELPTLTRARQEVDVEGLNALIG